MIKSFETDAGYDTILEASVFFDAEKIDVLLTQ